MERKLMSWLLLPISFVILTSCSHKALRKLPIPDVEVTTPLSESDGAVVGHIISSSESRITWADLLKSLPGSMCLSQSGYGDLKAWIEKVCREVKCDPKLVKALTKYDRRYQTNYPPEE